MYPHQKLDWNLSRLERRLSETPDDAAARLDYARHCLSRARYHGGGEAWFNKALTQARRVLQHDPSPSALAVAGASLVGLSRTEHAMKYLDQALKLDPERAEVRLALGELHRHDRSRHQAVRELEMACRLAPDSWETHYLLGRVLAERAEELNTTSGRLFERSQYHMVRALQLGPSAELEGTIVFALGGACLQAGRIEEAHKLFVRLCDHERHVARARYFLGLCAYELGKYKNAILYLRQHLEDLPENPHVYARIGLAYLQLGEIVKAREACNRALAIEPSHLRARWTLGCAMLEENRIDDATRVFREILADAPEHLGAFSELVQIRSAQRDLRWLKNALRSEVGIHDRLPVQATRESLSTGHHVVISPRQTTRSRIGLVLAALRESSGPGVIETILAAVNLTTDEGLRFQLWNTALDLVAAERTSKVIEALDQPGNRFTAALGREALLLASMIPEPLLTRGLDLNEADLRRAAVDRHGSAQNVSAHRENIDHERSEARAWQAWLLLAISAHDTRSARNLLVRWSSDADPDISVAADASLALLGDVSATRRLRTMTQTAEQQLSMRQLVSNVSVPRSRYHPAPVSADDVSTSCSCCNKTTLMVPHILAGGAAAMCCNCMTEVARNRQELAISDPTVACTLCGKTNLQSRGTYRISGLCVCADCVDNSLGMAEREEVDRFLATL